MPATGVTPSVPTALAESACGLPSIGAEPSTSVKVGASVPGLLMIRLRVDGRRGVVGIVAGERRGHGVEAGAGRHGRVAVVGELEAAIDGGDAVNADGRRGRRRAGCRRN